MFKLNPFRTVDSMINTEEVDVSENLANNQGAFEMLMKDQIDKHKNTMIYNMIKHLNLYPRDKESNTDTHKYHYTYKNKESNSKLKRKKLPFEYVRLQNRVTGNRMYFRAFDERDIGFSNNDILYKNLILHNRDIDSDTNIADLERSFEKVKDDLKEGFAGHALGLIENRESLLRWKITWLWSIKRTPWCRKTRGFKKKFKRWYPAFKFY